LTRREDAWEKIASRDPNDVASRLNLALVRIQAKKYDEAQKILDALKAKTPELLEVLGVQVSLYVEQGKTDEALRLCDQMAEKLRSAPAYALRARVYIRLKQKLYESNPKDPDLKALRDYDEKALADFGRIIALDPQKAERWATRANYSHVIGRMREGLPDARKALELAPDNVAIQKLAVLLLIDASIEGHDSSLLGESGVLVDKVLAAFEKSPPTGTDDPRMRDYTELRLLKARVLMLKPATGPGLEEARRLLREVTTQQPKVAEAWQWLAQLELDQEDPAKAADLALQGLTYNPDDGRLLLLRARAEKARQPAVAALTLLGLLDRNPQNVEVLIELADAYTRANRAPQAAELLRQKLPEFAGRDRRLCEIALAEAVYASGQRDEAKALYEQLTQADPNNAAPTMSLAQRQRKDKRWTEMYQLVRRWLAAHPQDVDVAATIAQILAAAGDRQALQMGEDILRITLDRHPQALRPLGLLAMMMQDMGRNEEAARLYRKVLELDPKSAAALNNLAWILCDQEDHPDQYQEALELAARGLALVPESVDLLDTRGYACYRLGDFDKAAADFRRCIDLYPPNSPVAATPRYHLALVYSAMKRKAEAVGQLQQALGSNRTTIARTAKEQKDAGRVTYAIKLLKDALQLRDQMEPLRTALGLADDAGASTEQLAEAKGLLEELQKGI
jgi:tetratricopeptide (TPR) repeat protein